MMPVVLGGGVLVGVLTLDLEIRVVAERENRETGNEKKKEENR